MNASRTMLFLIPFVIIARVHAQITPSMEKVMRIGCIPLAAQCGFDISKLAAGVSIDSILDENSKKIWPCMCLGEASAFTMNKCLRAAEDAGLYADLPWSIPDVNDEFIDKICERLDTPRTKKPAPPTPSPTLSPTINNNAFFGYILGSICGVVVVIALFVICRRRWQQPPDDNTVTTEMTSL